MKIYCKSKYWSLNEDYNIDKILYLLIDRPDGISCYNNFIWNNKKDQFHREYDLPAYINNNGYSQWRKNNNFHRENNKPAVIYVTSLKEYYLYNNFIKEERKNNMKRLCKNKQWKIDKEYDLDKILYLLIDRPVFINKWKDFVWENKDEFHREYGLPSIINIDGIV